MPLYRRGYRADDAPRIDGGKSHGRKRYRLRLQIETNHQRLRAEFVRSLRISILSFIRASFVHSISHYYD